MSRILRFIVSGGLSAATLMAIFYVLTELAGLWYVAAAVIAWILSLLVSFTLQRTWTFRVSGREGAGGHLAAFVVLGLANTAINAGLLFALVEWAGAPELVAQAGLVLLIAAWNYVIMRRLIFRAA